MTTAANDTRRGAATDRTYVLRPPAWKIAKYWFRQGEFGVAPGEPACFACHWRDDRAPIYPSVSVPDAWTRSKLERAHLVPHALGGSDEDVSNYVMLCPPCHKAAPDWRDPEVMLRWVRSQKHYLVARADAAIATWAQLWPGRPLTAELVEGVDRAALAALLIERAGTHAHRLKPATIVAALGELTAAADVADTGTADAGRLPFLLLDLFAEVERTFTAQRVADIRAATAASGRRTARRMAHGEAEIVHARLLRTQGQSLTQIVSATGIPKSSLRRYLRTDHEVVRGTESDLRPVTT